MSPIQTAFSTPVSHCRFTASGGYVSLVSVTVVVFHRLVSVPA